MSADDTDHVALRFPLEELRELGFDPSPLPSPDLPTPETDDERFARLYPKRLPAYTPQPAAYATPWHVADYDERVLVLDSDGTSLFEVFPGQAHGYVATRDDRRAIAEAIVEAMNAHFGDEWSPVTLRREMVAALLRGFVDREIARREGSVSASTDAAGADFEVFGASYLRRWLRERSRTAAAPRASGASATPAE